MNLKENLSIAKEIAREAGDFLLDNKNKTKQIFSEEGRDIKPVSYTHLTLPTTTIV